MPFGEKGHVYSSIYMRPERMNACHSSSNHRTNTYGGSKSVADQQCGQSFQECTRGVLREVQARYHSRYKTVPERYCCSAASACREAGTTWAHDV